MTKTIASRRLVVRGNTKGRTMNSYTIVTQHDTGRWTYTEPSDHDGEPRTYKTRAAAERAAGNADPRTFAVCSTTEAEALCRA